MRHRRIIPVLAISIILASACSDSPTEPQGIQALYTLITLNNHNLPTLGAPNGGCPVNVTNGSFALDTSGRYSALLDAGDSVCPDGRIGKAYWTDSGSYTIHGAQIELVPDGDDAPYSGHFEAAGEETEFLLVVNHTRGEYHFFRVPFR
jgi:hypothetical protein